MLKDEIFIERIRRGDTECFSEWFEEHYDRYWSFAMQLLKDRSAAEDAVQSVFMKIWMGRRKLDPKGSLEGYFLTSLRHEIYNQMRLKFNAARVQVNDIPEMPQTEDNPQVIVEGLEMQERLNRSVASMPRQRQRIFRMNRLDGLSAEEISTRLGLSKRTVERHLYLAMKEIKHLFS